MIDWHERLKEASKWPYDLPGGYSVEYLLTKMPKYIKDLHLKMLKSDESYDFWYMDEYRGEDKDPRIALVKLALAILRKKR